MSIFGNPVMLGGSGGGGGVPIVAKSDWDELTTAQKQAYGLVVVQEYTDGFYEGMLFNGADYTTQPSLITSKYMNGVSSTPLQYTFGSSGDYTIMLALPHGKQLANLNLTLNNTSITSALELLCDSNNPVMVMNVYGLQRAFVSGDVLSAANTATDVNSGVQMFVFDNVLPENIRLVGAINNTGETFVIPQSDYAWYFQVAKFGYYQGANTIPETSIFQDLTEGSISTPCPANQSQYYYGGTYVVTLL